MGAAMCDTGPNLRHLTRDMDARLAPVARAWNEERAAGLDGPGLFARLADWLAALKRKDARDV